MRYRSKNIRDIIGYDLAVAVGERAKHTEPRCHLMHNLLHDKDPQNTRWEDL